MSPSPSPLSSKSKSKDKRVAGKELLKSCAKPTTNANTFHTLENPPVSSVPPVDANARFRNNDDRDDPCGNTGVEYDCVSNNGSWSGESEDPKDKTCQGPSRPGVDSDKREKIRQKNEKKHQRQKERRAQELHERCCGYLMSRKVEALAQQLVAMGFPLERARTALILKQGRVEESVAWLLEGGNNQRENKNNLDSSSKLKVDVSQELAQIADMQIKLKCSKLEVERAVVACEGDLEQAAQNLMKLQKHEAKVESAGAISIQKKPDDKDMKKIQPQQQIGNELKKLHLGAVSESKHIIPSTNIMNVNPNEQFRYQHQHYVSSSEPVAAMNQFTAAATTTNNNNGMWKRRVGSGPGLAAASSLGLFTGWGSHGNVDWDVADASQFDYTKIDWSLDRLPPSSSGSKNGCEKSGEWASPFEEKDLFGLPRQYVSSPSL